MSALPPVDPAESRRLIAERGGWPAGALEACAQLALEYESWLVFWTAGGMPLSPDPGFRAVLVLHGHRSNLHAATIEELRVQVAAVDAELPPSALDGSALGRYHPLVPLNDSRPDD